MALRFFINTTLFSAGKMRWEKARTIVEETETGISSSQGNLKAKQL